ncbi:50S ribosomal protein L23 [Candidatus Falkowbacteria bacterium CG1_02_41_21]|uniref:Large ribosomal subunit protein uL23 n=1 Tax=Candidatus Falkowbacteria bacterium CG1_02_41_21 TaxID=1805147 RepID=A0A1J4T9B9_9BACT|nr:MAG: 50S ribosomal protein L23 [Candidatus Falkowbacteria bacterium CG1_02_41_21]
MLVKPLVTEKATNLGGQNKYVFIVDINANKIEVAKAIDEVYGLNPISVNMVKMKGKQVARGRITGRRKDFKKAIVTLKKGETIQVYEGV